MPHDVYALKSKSPSKIKSNFLILKMRIPFSTRFDNFITHQSDYKFDMQGWKLTTNHEPGQKDVSHDQNPGRITYVIHHVTHSRIFLFSGQIPTRI